MIDNITDNKKQFGNSYTSSLITNIQIIGERYTFVNTLLGGTWKERNHARWKSHNLPVYILSKRRYKFLLLLIMSIFFFCQNHLSFGKVKLSVFDENS